MRAGTLRAGGWLWAAAGSALLKLILLAALVGATTPGGVRAADAPIDPSTLSVTDYHAILDDCAPTWDPSDRNIYTTDGFSLNDVDRATRTSFVTVWQLDAWPRWRWEAECLGSAFLRSVDAPAASVGAAPTRQAALNPAPDSAISPSGVPVGDYHELLDRCTPAWNPADRNIYTTDGFSLNDADRATRTSFVTVWQLDAWPRWRWEVECLGTNFTWSVGGTSTRQAALSPTSDSAISPSGVPVGDYREILDRCAPAWNPADRNIYTTDGFSLNDVDQATRTSFVTVWQINAWPRWRWEVECLGSLFTWSVGGISARQATLDPTPDSPIDLSGLPIGDYRQLLERCTPAWDPTNRNIYTTDGSSLNDVDRATRTSFVSVWQIDAWPRWRWESNCLQGTFTSTVDAPVTTGGRSVTTLGRVGTAYDPLSPPNMAHEVYLAILGHCTPSWDPTNRNIYTTDGFSLNDVDRATRTSFVSVWQVDAWPRWRWEVNCLQGAFTPSGISPVAAGVSPIAAVGSPVTPVGITPNQETTSNPTNDPAYLLIYEVALARGADATLAQQIAVYVVTEGDVSDFLNGVHLNVAHGEYDCRVRSAACPLAPEAQQVGESFGPPGAPSTRSTATPPSSPGSPADAGSHSGAWRDNEALMSRIHWCGDDRRIAWQKRFDRGLDPYGVLDSTNPNCSDPRTTRIVFAGDGSDCNYDSILAEGRREGEGFIWDKYNTLLVACDAERHEADRDAGRL